MVSKTTRAMAALRIRETATNKGSHDKNEGKSEQSTRRGRITNIFLYDTEAVMKASLSEASCTRGEAA